MPKIAAIQMVSNADVKKNLQDAKILIHEAKNQGADLIVLPENFSAMFFNEEDRLNHAENFGEGVVQKFLQEQAQLLNVWIVAGTIPLKSSDSKKVFSSCLVIDNHGVIQTRYDKIHLFDVDIHDQKKNYRESFSTAAGNKITILKTPFGCLGLAICYDLRFPEMFREMVLQGAEIFVIPSAFTYVTGQAHWQVLLQARAIENQSFVIAADQGGLHENHRETYGHSMIVDPWGMILQIHDQNAGIVIADIDLNEQKKLRESFPVLKHRKF